MSHDKLRAALRVMPQDYDPWGQNERWKDPNLAYPDCSSGCAHFVQVYGEFGADWGVCVNPQSHRCGLLTFEHQGCQAFELDPKWERDE